MQPQHFGPELEKLRRMQSDGLLTIGPDRLQVLPAGRLLVRNICMVFDHYLKSGSGSFSKVIATSCQRSRLCRRSSTPMSAP